MSVRAVDPARSRIVLIGTPHYTDERLPDVPVVANNIADLAAVFTDPDLGGFDVEHCVATPTDADLAGIGEALSEAAEQARDLLLIYYSGHGLLDRYHELYLSLAATRPDRLLFTGLPFETVRKTCLHSPASNRVVILDSCFSGRAIGQPLANDEEAVLGQLTVAGTYTLTSAPANRTAQILPHERHTAFTKRLLDIFRQGVPQAGPLLSLGDIYKHLYIRLQADGLPLPQQRGTDTADLLGLVRNRWSAPKGVAELPEALRTALNSSFPRVQLGAVVELGRWLREDDPQRAATASLILRSIVSGDDAVLALRAQRALREAGLQEGARRTVGAAADSPLKARALELLDRASDLIPSLSYEGAKLRAQSSIGQTIAIVDPDRAIVIADAIDDASWRDPVLVAAAKTLASTAPGLAISLMLAIQEEHSRFQATAAVAAAIATTDPEGAYQMAARIAYRIVRSEALVGVAHAIAPTDPDRAEAILDVVERNVADAGRTDERLAIIGAIATADIERALRLADLAARHYYREQALLEIVRAVVPTDPTRALDIAALITNSERRATALSRVIPALAKSDPDSVRRIADEATGRLQITALATIDPDRALAIAEADPDFDSLQTGIARDLANLDPDRAVQIAEGITNVPTRMWALIHVAREWLTAA